MSARVFDSLFSWPRVAGSVSVRDRWHWTLMSPNRGPREPVCIAALAPRQASGAASSVRHSATPPPRWRPCAPPARLSHAVSTTSRTSVVGREHTAAAGRAVGLAPGAADARRTIRDRAAASCRLRADHDRPITQPARDPDTIGAGTLARRDDQAAHRRLRPGAVQRVHAPIPPAVSPYADPEYRAALELLARGEHRCAYCGAVASSPDHVPAIAEHRHVRGSGCCRLVPACRRCNYGRGARLTNRRRRRSSPTRLAPGSGSL